MSNETWTMPEWMREVCEANGISVEWHTEQMRTGCELRVWSAQDTINLLESLHAAGLLRTPARKQFDNGVVADFRNERRQLRNDLARLEAEIKELRSIGNPTHPMGAYCRKQDKKIVELLNDITRLRTKLADATEALQRESRAVADANRENEKLQAWVNDLQSGMYINCVYCGHRYGPDDGEHLESMRDALHKHVENCPKHPMSKLKTENEELREMLLTCRGAINAQPDDAFGIGGNEGFDGLRRPIKHQLLSDIDQALGADDE